MTSCRQEADQSAGGDEYKNMAFDAESQLQVGPLIWAVMGAKLPFKSTRPKTPIIIIIIIPILPVLARWLKPVGGSVQLKSGLLRGDGL